MVAKVHTRHLTENRHEFRVKDNIKIRHFFGTLNYPLSYLRLKKL